MNSAKWAIFIHLLACQDEGIFRRWMESQGITFGLAMPKAWDTIGPNRKKFSSTDVYWGWKKIFFGRRIEHVRARIMRMCAHPITPRAPDLAPDSEKSISTYRFDFELICDYHYQHLSPSGLPF